MDADLDELSTQSRQRRLLLQAVGGAALAGGLGVTGRAMAQTQPLDTSILDVVIIAVAIVVSYWLYQKRDIASPS